MSSLQDQGFVIVPRELMQNAWYGHSPTIHLYLHCLLRANYVDSEWRGITIKRGQFVTSLHSLSQETGLTVKQLRSALDRLKRANYVASKATNKYRIITILNYDDIQIRASKKANKGQAKGKQRATNNNLKNKKNYNVGQSPTAYSALFKEIIMYLNKQAEKRYKVDSVSTQRYITARLNEGYTVDDFKYVIDVKCSDWKGTENDKYLRPETLFGTKFEGYLNSKPEQADKTHLSRAEREEMKRRYNANSGFKK